MGEALWKVELYDYALRFLHYLFPWQCFWPLQVCYIAWVMFRATYFATSVSRQSYGNTSNNLSRNKKNVPSCFSVLQKVKIHSTFSLKQAAATCNTGCAWDAKRATSLSFQQLPNTSFPANVARHVGHFCCSYYRSLKCPSKLYKGYNAMEHTKYAKK